uniref:Uncharacterized protein n=1 Tax=Zea mays TaxID=4577 RepID=C0P2V0_MAIZE|nr:unknown [Zea mays]
MKLVVLDCFSSLSISSTDFIICSELVSITCPPDIISSKMVCSAVKNGDAASVSHLFCCLKHATC